jgi:hypothetical protein
MGKVRNVRFCIKCFIFGEHKLNVMKNRGRSFDSVQSYSLLLTEFVLFFVSFETFFFFSDQASAVAQSKSKTPGGGIRRTMK